MKAYIFILLFLICQAHTLHAQNESILIKGRRYQGYIFDTSYFVLKSIENQVGRINLSLEEVKLAESILKTKLSKINSNKHSQTSSCPNIEKYLNKYFRQYFGFINNRGENVVWINMFWNKDLNENAKHNLIIVSDGCSYYWDIEVNIATEALKNLAINGNG